MNVAFYAPLKPADHAVPSGDRQIARALLKALAHAGHDVVVASRFRSFDGAGDRDRQRRLQRIGERQAARVIKAPVARPPDAWLTYHVYHKAPDFVGPAVCRALHIPYVIAEASISPKQRDGPWADGHARTLDAVRAADAIACLNPKDVAALARVCGSGTRLAMLRPFIDVAAFAASGAPRSRRDHAPVELITVAMMRDGAKLASYRALAAALETLRDLDWTLRIVGDGPARDRAERAFERIGDRVRWAGQLDPRALRATLSTSDVFVWPAIDEAIGIAFLEAQACGVPVVGGRSPGVCAVVADARTGLLAPEGDVAGFAAATRRLITDAPLRHRMGAAASLHVRTSHDVAAGAAVLDALLRDAVQRQRALA